ncbi:MAG: YbaB/EbfC family nucleoid-associated protein, partial [Anaerolineae bacterium]|nr:YbaB/EbfC family nucleoid-associated protein [Anaerolineae bacterium]
MRVGGGGMMGQIQKLQEEMARIQEALGEETVEASAGGGAVVVVMNGHQRVESIRIDPAAVDPDDVEMLQD